LKAKAKLTITGVIFMGTCFLQPSVNLGILRLELALDIFLFLILIFSKYGKDEKKRGLKRDQRNLNKPKISADHKAELAELMKTQLEKHDLAD